MKEKTRIYKNVFVISFAFLCQFTAFNGIGNIQSSINCEDGLGTATLACIYGGLVVSCMFLPTVTIQKFGLKWTLAFSVLGYLTYTLCNFEPQFYTLIPAALVLGFCAAPLWSSKAQYLTVSASKLAELEGVRNDTIVNRFFGIFFCIFQLNQIFGNLISSLIIAGGLPSFESLGEATDDEIQDKRDKCGMNQPRPNSDESDCGEAALEKETAYLLMGVYSAVVLAAFLLVVIFVDQLEIKELEEKASAKKLVATTLKHTISDNRQLLLIPLTIYSGLEQSFIIDNFTSAYINCTFGTEWIGFVMIFYGISNSLFSFISGVLEGLIGRLPLFITGATVNLILILALLLEWIYPHPNHIEWLFLYGVGWGACDSVWQCAINALYGCLFKEHQEAAFANYRLFESIGFLVAFAYASALNTQEKLYIVLTFLILGMIGYAFCEIYDRKHVKVNEDRNSNNQVPEKVPEAAL